MIEIIYESYLHVFFQGKISLTCYLIYLHTDKPQLEFFCFWKEYHILLHTFFILQSKHPESKQAIRADIWLKKVSRNEWNCIKWMGVPIGLRFKMPGVYSRGCNPLSRSLTNDAIKQATAFPFAFARLISATLLLLLLCEEKVFEKHYTYVLKLILACASQWVYK